MVSNLVAPVSSRFTVIRPDLLPAMQVLERISTERMISDRMQKLKLVWAEHDPPNAAQYDVENQEFDPLKIQAEMSAYFELMVRDRVNQAARAITLAFSVGGDLDAIGSRYPYGVPRLTGESDTNYRTRLWLSPSIFSLGGAGQGTYESYVFWALTAPMPLGQLPLKHVTASTIRNTGDVYLTLLSSSAFNETWTVSLDGLVHTLLPGINPVPTDVQKDAVYRYISAPGVARQGLTDVLHVLGPKVVNTTIDVEVWAFPGVDRAALLTTLKASLVDLIKALWWLGADLTDLALKGSMAQAGVYKVKVNSPNGDVVAPVTGYIDVESIKLKYMGTGE